MAVACKTFSNSSVLASALVNVITLKTFNSQDTYLLYLSLGIVLCIHALISKLPDQKSVNLHFHNTAVSLSKMRFPRKTHPET